MLPLYYIFIFIPL